jgi:hypothetical protein
MSNEAAGVSCGSHRQACLLNEAVMVELKTLHGDFCETVSFSMPHKYKIDRTGSARGERGGHNAQLNIPPQKKTNKKLYITVGGVSCCTVSLEGGGLSRNRTGILIWRENCTTHC